MSTCVRTKLRYPKTQLLNPTSSALRHRPSNARAVALSPLAMISRSLEREGPPKRVKNWSSSSECLPTPARQAYLLPSTSKFPALILPSLTTDELNLSSRSDSEPPSAISAITRTPRSALTLARNLPLPPSPAQLADKIETQTISLTTTLSGYVSSSPLPSFLNTARYTLSSAIAIELLTLFIEAWGLRSQVLPMRYLTTFPAMPALGTGELAVKIPDLFALLTLGFWGPVGLWLATSVGTPLIGAWMFNLTHGQRDYDPVSFNVVKGLVAWIVYAKGGVSGASKGVVEKGVPGGAVGMMIGAGVGVLVSIYEALLRK